MRFFSFPFTETIQSIIIACAVLHNIAIAGDEPMPPLNNEIEPIRCVSTRIAPPPAQNVRGISSRHCFILEHFSNDRWPIKRMNSHIHTLDVDGNGKSETLLLIFISKIRNEMTFNASFRLTKYSLLLQSFVLRNQLKSMDRWIVGY